MTKNIIKIFSTIFILWIILTGLTSLYKEKPENKLNKISKDYKKYELFKYKNTDSLSILKWTISLCTAYKPGNTTEYVHKDSFLISTTPEIKNEHGNKLYKLYVKNIKSYSDTSEKVQPIGQVLVKETWNVQEINKNELLRSNKPLKKNKNDGKWYTPTTISELFIMYKEDLSPNNDNGWVYGIIKMDNSAKKPKILEDGKISRCIGCHKGTKYDRIFGVK